MKGRKYFVYCRQYFFLE